MMYNRSHYTRIQRTEFDLFMYRLNMSLQISLLTKLMTTLITRIFDFFMYRLNMFFQTSLCSSLVIALITRTLLIFHEQTQYVDSDFPV